jgi:hypothetical protein
MSTITARQILTAAEAAKTRRLEAERTNGPYDWADMESLREFLAVIESVTFWTRSDPNGRSVVVKVADTYHGRLWTHVGAEILDSAAGQFVDLPDTARIDSLGATTHALTW